MLDRVNNRFYIAEGEYAFIAPSIDKNGIEEIASTGFATCFALSVTDREKRLALLAHIDTASWSQNLIPESIELFKTLGAESLKIKVANLENQRKNTEFDSLILSSAFGFVNKYYQALKAAGFQVKPPKHLLRCLAVLVTPNEGLRIQPRELHLAYERPLMERAKARAGSRMSQALAGNTSLIVNTYRPNLVLPAA